MIFARFSESGKTPWTRHLLIKFDSIGTRTLTLALIMLVRILSQPTLFLFLSLRMTLVMNDLI